MKKRIVKIIDFLKKEKVETAGDLVIFKNKYKSTIENINNEFISLSPSDKKLIGGLMKELKETFKNKYKLFISEINSTEEGKRCCLLDGTLPVAIKIGSRHPLSSLMCKMQKFFLSFGFDIVATPEIEDDWHNFTALNMPEDHPARDMQDTFFLDPEKKYALRTHTTSAQIRILEKKQPPIHCICIGKTFRNETTSARANEFFHQIDGFVVDKKISFLDFKYMLNKFLKYLFGEKTKMRIRSSYFPFTSPSVEVDIECLICHGEGCLICKHSGWLEILGGGLIHNNVLENCNVDSSTFSGYAFGGGVERIAMLIHRINDIRLFYENDMRFLQQFI